LPHCGARTAAPLLTSAPFRYMLHLIYPNTWMTPDDLAPIPGGEFLMGQAVGRDEEKPVHAVRVAPFLLCRYQVTIDDYARVMGRFPNQSPGFPPELPVTSVSWFAAVEFCDRLSREWGLNVRLPTEAEW